MGGCEGAPALTLPSLLSFTTLREPAGGSFPPEHRNGPSLIGQFLSPQLCLLLLSPRRTNLQAGERENKSFPAPPARPPYTRNTLASVVVCPIHAATMYDEDSWGGSESEGDFAMDPMDVIVHRRPMDCGGGRNIIAKRVPHSPPPLPRPIRWDPLSDTDLLVLGTRRRLFQIGRIWAAAAAAAAAAAEAAARTQKAAATGRKANTAIVGRRWEEKGEEGFGEGNLRRIVVVSLSFLRLAVSGNQPPINGPSSAASETLFSIHRPSFCDGLPIPFLGMKETEEKDGENITQGGGI